MTGPQWPDLKELSEDPEFASGFAKGQNDTAKNFCEVAEQTLEKNGEINPLTRRERVIISVLAAQFTELALSLSLRDEYLYTLTHRGQKGQKEEFEQMKAHFAKKREEE